MRASESTANLKARRQNRELPKPKPAKKSVQICSKWQWCSYSCFCDVSTIFPIGLSPRSAWRCRLFYRIAYLTGVRRLIQSFTQGWVPLQCRRVIAFSRHECRRWKKSRPCFSTSLIMQHKWSVRCGVARKFRRWESDTR